jgi:YggT family protein
VDVVAQVVATAAWLFLLLLLFRLVMEYVFLFARSYEPHGAMLIAVEGAYTITDPPLKLLRRFIPPLRLGGISIDLSFIVLFLLVQVVIYVVAPAIGSLG